MFFVSKIAIPILILPFLVVAQDEPARDGFHQVQTDIAYIRNSFEDFNTLIQSFPDSGGQDEQTKEIYYSGVDVIDNIQWATESVWGFNSTYGAFNGVEAQNLVELTDDLLSPIETVLNGLIDKSDALKAVGLGGSSEQLELAYHEVLVSTRDSFAQLLDFTTEFLPDDYKSYFQDVSGQLSPVFDLAITVYEVKE